MALASPGGGSSALPGERSSTTSPRKQSQWGWQQGSQGSSTRMGCAGPKASVAPKPLLAPAQSETTQTHRRKSPGFLSSCVQAQEGGPSAGGPKGLCPLGSRENHCAAAPSVAHSGCKKRVRTSNPHTYPTACCQGGTRTVFSAPACLTCCAWGLWAG